MTDLTRLTAILTADVTGLKQAMDGAAKMVKDASRQMQLDFTGAGKGVTDLGSEITREAARMEAALGRVINSVNQVGRHLNEQSRSARGWGQAFSLSLSGILEGFERFAGFKVVQSLASLVEETLTAGAKMQEYRASFQQFFGIEQGNVYFEKAEEAAQKYGRTIQWVTEQFHLFAEVFSTRGHGPEQAAEALDKILVISGRLKLSNEQVNKTFDVLMDALNRGQMPAYFFARRMQDFGGGVDAARQAIHEFYPWLKGTDEELRHLGEIKVDVPFIQRVLDIWAKTAKEQGQSVETWAKAVTRLQNAWEGFLDSIARLGVLDATIAAVNDLAKAIDGVNKGVYSSAFKEGFANSALNPMALWRVFTTGRVEEGPPVEEGLGLVPGAGEQWHEARKGMSEVQNQMLNRIRQWVETLGLPREVGAYLASIGKIESGLGTASPASLRAAELATGVYGPFQMKPGTLGEVPFYAGTSEEERKAILRSQVLAPEAAARYAQYFLTQRGVASQYSPETWVAGTSTGIHLTKGEPVGLKPEAYRYMQSYSKDVRGLFAQMSAALYDIPVETQEKKVNELRDAIAKTKEGVQDYNDEWVKNAEVVADTYAVMDKKGGDELKKLIEGLKTEKDHVAMVQKQQEDLIRTGSDVKPEETQARVTDALDREAAAAEKVKRKIDEISASVGKAADLTTTKYDQAYQRYVERTQKLATWAATQIQAGTWSPDTAKQYVAAQQEIFDTWKKEADFANKATSAITDNSTALQVDMSKAIDNAKAQLEMAKAQNDEKLGLYGAVQAAMDHQLALKQDAEWTDLAAKQAARLKKALDDLAVAGAPPEQAEAVKAVNAKLSAEENAELKTKQMINRETEMQRKAAKDIKGSWITEFHDMAEQLQGVFQKFFVDVMEGKFDQLGVDFKQMIDQMVAKFLSSQLMNLLFGSAFMGQTGNLGGLLGGTVTSIGNALFGPVGGGGTAAAMGAVGGSFGLHTGGLGYEARPLARMHGGWATPDEIPTLIKRDEGVFTPGQMRALGAAMRGDGIRQAQPTINITVHTPDVTGFRRSQRQIVEDAMRTASRVANQGRR